MMQYNNAEIAKVARGHYCLADLRRVRSFLTEKGTFEYKTFSTGLFPASIVRDDTEYTGYSHVWVRDNVYTAYSFHLQGKHSIAAKCLRAITDFYGKHRHRFEHIINGTSLPANPMEYPHVRFDGKNLTEIRQRWPHRQNDALGYYVWLYCKMANEAHVSLTAKEIEILSLFPAFFDTVQYWQDEDSGHWEEFPKTGASSIGVVVAGLEELKSTVDRPSYTPLFRERGVTTEYLSQLIVRGRAELDLILPAECIQKNKEKFREYDAALLFLIYPLGVAGGETADIILNQTISHLQGAYGIRRYIGDSYWAPDYKAKLPPSRRTSDYSLTIRERNRLLTEIGREAQWCIFDSIISAIYGTRYHTTGDSGFLKKQAEYFNRALGQITGPSGSVPGFKCPEMYYLENGRYVPNDNVPLLWAQSNLLLAIKKMEQSLVM